MLNISMQQAHIVCMVVLVQVNLVDCEYARVSSRRIMAENGRLVRRKVDLVGQQTIDFLQNKIQQIIF